MTATVPDRYRRNLGWGRRIRISSNTICAFGREPALIQINNVSYRTHIVFTTQIGSQIRRQLGAWQCQFSFILWR